MKRYETLFLAGPEITADEANTIESQLDEIVTNAKGKVISYERWGKYFLAYPIKKYEYGVYFLMRFEVSDENKSELLTTIRNLFVVKYSDLILRNTIVYIPEHKTLEYNRPESLEEIPTRDVDTFLKENKMTGLLGKGSAHQENDLDQKEELS